MVSQNIAQSLEPLAWAAQAFDFGLLHCGPDGLRPENALMESIQKRVNGLEVFDSETIIDAPLKVVSSGGETLYFTLKRYLIDDQNSMVVVHDVSEQVLRDAELTRTQELLEAAGAEKTGFISHMGHELRSPLNSILVLSKMFTKKGQNTLSERQIKSAEMIHRSGNQLLRLIDDIMDLARVEAGMISAEVGESNVRAVVKSCIRDLGDLADSKNIKIEFTVDEDVPELIETDKVRLSQVIRILISNAVKFTRKGSVRTEVKLLTGDRIQISVIDTGMGMSAQHRQKLADGLEQKGSLTGKESGAGLGLNLTRNMVSLLQGKIKLTSEVQKGSCFSVSLPRQWQSESSASTNQSDAVQIENVASNEVAQVQHQAEVKNQVDPQGLRDAITPTENTSSKAKVAVCDDAQLMLDKPDKRVVEACVDLMSKRILLVDGDIREVFTLMAALEPFGLDVVVAQDGAEALQKLSDQACPDLVLMDSQSPSMNGIEAVEKIRGQSRLKHLPVIAVLGSESELEGYRGAGVSDCLAKPIDINLLVNKMSTAIRNDHRR